MMAQREWHLITSEYPPQVGGVSDHTHLLAAALADAGDIAHVWCPEADGDPPQSAGVFVHRELGRFSARDLSRVGQSLDRFPFRRRLLVQWVPHGYGYRAMNIPFCLWLLGRARAGDRIELVVHEPFLAFREGSWRQDAVALVHRAMTIALLRAAERVWVSTPGWVPCIRRYALGHPIPFTWLPIGSTVPTIVDQAGVSRVRRRYAGRARHLLGHFGTHCAPITRHAEEVVAALVQNSSDINVLLLGIGSANARDHWVRRHPQLAERVSASGFLHGDDLSRHLSACDVMFQPFPDGVSARRTSLIAALAHSLPVVTTAGRLTESFWAETGAVVLTPVGDVTKAVRTVSRLLENPDERKGIALLAGGLYESKFAMKHAVTALRAA